MRTLILKHQGHEAHVPYELPVGEWFDVFVPGHGICSASVLLRSELIEVSEVTPKGQGHFPGAIDGAELHPAVLEQAGDVCAVFERALGALARMGDSGPSRALDASLAKMFPQTQEDAKVLSTIAEMALLESDLHTAWCRLPASVGPHENAPPEPSCPEESYAHLALQRFIEHVLVPRAQDLASAAAKRRMDDWGREREEAYLRAVEADRADARIKAAKERA